MAGPFDSDPSLPHAVLRQSQAVEHEPDDCTACSVSIRPMNTILKLIVQVLILFALLLAATLVTLKIKYRDADGPSVLFPGGRLVSGELYTGPEPDWRFTDEVFVIELQLEHPLSSRRVFVMESDGRLFVPSGYMRSMLGRLWKDWAFQAAEGDGLAVIRINGVRYERRLLRRTDPAIIAGVARKLAQKYAGGASEDNVAAVMKSIADGDTWIFELAPRTVATSQPNARHATTE